MDIVICGSRSFSDYEQICATLCTMKISKVISGGATGADKLAERYAADHGLPMEVIKPDWNKHGKKAGMLRNMEMADKANFVFAFWDGQSPGTREMINYCKRKNIPIEVHQPSRDSDNA